MSGSGGLSRPANSVMMRSCGAISPIGSFNRQGLGFSTLLNSEAWALDLHFVTLGLGSLVEEPQLVKRAAQAIRQWVKADGKAVMSVPWLLKHSKARVLS